MNLETLRPQPMQGEKSLLLRSKQVLRLAGSRQITQDEGGACRGKSSMESGRIELDDSLSLATESGVLGGVSASLAGSTFDNSLIFTLTIGLLTSPLF